MTVCKWIRITGRVQGVAFRASTVGEARELGLRGWVVNRVDGSVEVMVAGEQEGVDALIRWCHHGPPAARVNHVEVTDVPIRHDLPEPFTIRNDLP